MNNRNHKGLNRLICAAVVNQDFRHRLLKTPLEAALSGYMGHKFALTTEELQMLCSIDANDFQTFSQRVCDWISANGDKGNSHRCEECDQCGGEELAPIEALWLSVAKFEK